MNCCMNTHGLDSFVPCDSSYLIGTVNLEGRWYSKCNQGTVFDVLSDNTGLGKANWTSVPKRCPSN